ncbi:MAG: twin-arginine translocase TatA/TatE family subunit [Marmoricola sp.]|nr:twin-arginine translocase TatA/TatE family subunit [Marmoricola sp.]
MLRNGLEPWHIIVLLVVVLLVFGGKKLPELARGSGRALRIFKAETKGLMTDDEDDDAGKTADTGTAARVIDAPGVTAQPPAPQAEAARHDASTD